MIICEDCGAGFIRKDKRGPPPRFCLPCKKSRKIPARRRKYARHKANPVQNAKNKSAVLKHRLLRFCDYTISRLKCRAKREGLDFDLTTDDIVVPDVCPVLGIPLNKTVGEANWRTHSPSFDRVDNSKGYVRGNVFCISRRANELKRDGTIEEFEAIAKYMKDKLHV